MDELKKVVYERILQILEEKERDAQLAVENATESRNTETKSTAGDKHETGRAMSQIELDNSQMQFAKVIELKDEMESIDISVRRKSAGKGSIIKTNTGDYFIGIGLGRLEVKGGIVFVVSLQSPIGMVLNNKKVGEIIVFNGKEIEIQEIY